MEALQIGEGGDNTQTDERWPNPKHPYTAILNSSKLNKTAIKAARYTGLLYLTKTSCIPKIFIFFFILGENYF